MSTKNDMPMPPMMEGKKKKTESKYDPALLRRLIQEGKNANDIMVAMEIGHKQILKHHILKLIATDKTYYEVPGLYEKNNRKAFVNSRGEIRFRMNNIDFGDMGLTPETEFDVTVEGNQIILTNLSMDMHSPSENH